jgi:hypothetical protein
VLIFIVALGITLVPTPLLEPRYFTPGVVVAVLNSPPVSKLALVYCGRSSGTNGAVITASKRFNVFADFSQEHGGQDCRGLRGSSDGARQRSNDCNVHFSAIPVGRWLYRAIYVLIRVSPRL